MSGLHKSAKHLQCSSDFMNKTEERSNTAHPPFTYPNGSKWEFEVT